MQPTATKKEDGGYILKIPITTIDDFGNESVHYQKEEATRDSLGNQRLSAQSEVTAAQNKLDLINAKIAACDAVDLV